MQTMITNTYGAIDMGSNAIRLLICNAFTHEDGVQYKVVNLMRVPIRLGEDVFTEGRIPVDKQMALLDLMKGFHYMMKAYNVEAYRACGTSAMREAENGSEVAELIKHECGVNIEIISGEEEADLIFSSGMHEIITPEGNYLYVDVGGGSTEISVIYNGNRILSRSFKIGTVRMLKEAVAEDTLSELQEWLESVGKQYAPSCILGSGGNINRVRKILGDKSIQYQELKELYDSVTNMTIDERILKFGLNPYRADVIEYALKIFITVMKYAKVEDLQVPKLGLVDGIVRQLYNKDR
ncbi:MAG: hypothetical protein ACRCR3_06040 [Tannerellaceae bacterium]